MKINLLILSLIFGTTLLMGQERYPPAKVDIQGFESLGIEASEYRQHRLVSIKDFNKMASEKNTIILDTRSEEMYKLKHIKGAIHLNFSDFTKDKLAEIIPDKGTRILIYCNNNIARDPKFFAMKSGPLALNIPTFINLYGYGYKNIYELKDLIPVDSKDLSFEGYAVK